MIYVPEGEFSMGSNVGTSKGLPVHTVYLDAHWLDQTEVTSGMYACRPKLKGRKRRVGQM